MFILPDGKKNEFSKLHDTHLLNIASLNVYFQNIRFIKNGFELLDRETYEEFYLNFIKDIELVSLPMDAFVPNSVGPKPFVINQLVPEYERISKRVTLNELYGTLPITHPVHIKLKQDPTLLTTVLDDIFIHYSVFKYLDEISRIKIFTISNMTPVIEYVVDNIELPHIKRYLISKRINADKCKIHIDDILFRPDFNYVHDFYSEPHGVIPAFDVNNLIERLITNLVVKSDIYIIIGIYLILTFSISDITNDRIESRCVMYIRDVLSQL
jgi:hypothetical protein